VARREEARERRSQAESGLVDAQCTSVRGGRAALGPSKRRKPMKMKMFGREGSKHALGLEEEINDWLAEHPGIRIVDTGQCASGGSLQDTRLYVSIWYEED
jgi:hypothetical protein